MPVNKIKNKRYYFTGLLSFFCIIIYGSFAFLTFSQYQKEKLNDENNFRQQDSNFLTISKLREEKRLGNVISDLRIVQSLPAMKDFLLEKSDANKKKLQDLFYNFSLQRKVYDQIRYLDQNGQEIVRVNYVNGVPVVVPEEQLQNKKGRYYFDEALALSLGEIYISPMDLNIEGNKIEEPYKPMLRIATPLFVNNEKQGILIFNYLAQEVIDSLDVVNNNYSNTFLVDQNGYWLHSNNIEQEWGFMFPEKKDMALSKQNPTLWSLLQKNNDGQMFLEDGLYTFSTIVPVPNNKLSWKIYRFTPTKTVFAASERVKNRLLLSNFLIADFLLLVVVLAYFLFQRLDKQIQKTFESEEKFSVLFNSSADAIMTLEPPDWKFTSANLATLKMFGFKDEKEFVSIGPWDLAPEKQPDGQKSLEKSKKMINEAMEKGSVFFEWMHRKYKGKNFPATVMLTKVNYGGKEFLQATIRDITEQKKVEEVEKSKMEEIEKMNDLMIGRELKMVELKDKLNRIKKNK